MGMFDIPVPSKVNESIVIPKKTEIGVDSYNSAISALQKTFKEAADVIDSLEQLREQVLVEQQEEIDFEQENYTERALFESYCDGPIFEKVQDIDKKEVRRIAKKIREKMMSFDRIRKNGYFSLRGTSTTVWRRINNILNGIQSGLSAFVWQFIVWGTNMWIVDPAIIVRFNNSELNLRAWQTICYLVPRSGKISSIKKELNDEFKDILGDKYEIQFVKLKVIFAPWLGKREMEDDEDARGFHNILMIVGEKGTSTSNKEMSIKVDNEKGAKTLTVLKVLADNKADTKSKEGFINSITNIFTKIKDKFSKKKNDEKEDNTENKNESYELDLNF